FFSSGPNSNEIVIFDGTPGTHAYTNHFSTTAPDGTAKNESVTFDASDNYYVGHAGGVPALQKYDSTDTYVTSFLPATESQGTDWNDLAASGTTMFYTSEGTRVKVFDFISGQQPDFNDPANLPTGGDELPGSFAY